MYDSDVFLYRRLTSVYENDLFDLMIIDEGVKPGPDDQHQGWLAQPLKL